MNTPEAILPGSGAIDPAQLGTGSLPAARPGLRGSGTQESPLLQAPPLERGAGTSGAHHDDRDTNLTDADRGRIEREVEDLNKVLEAMGHRLEYGVHDETREFFVRLLDRRTSKEIRQIPPKEFLELRAKLHEFAGSAVGAVLDEKA